MRVPFAIKYQIQISFVLNLSNATSLPSAQGTFIIPWRKVEDKSFFICYTIIDTHTQQHTFPALLNRSSSPCPSHTANEEHTHETGKNTRSQNSTHDDDVRLNSLIGLVVKKTLLTRSPRHTVLKPLPITLFSTVPH